MKKYFYSALAVMAMLSVSSCFNEKDMDLTPKQELSESDDYGFIRVNATTDDAIVTRADAVADITTWFAKVSQGSTYYWGASGTTYTAITADLATTKIPAGATTVEVSNFATESGAYAVNPVAEADPAQYYGAAYWTGTLTKAVVAGTATEFPVACGAPANSKLTVTKTGFTGTDLKVYITSPRAVNFSGTTFGNDGVAYFPAGTVSLHITYDFGEGDDIRWPAGSTEHEVSLTAGHASTVNFTMNTNGTITLTITTEGYTNDDATSITFDAISGEEV